MKTKKEDDSAHRMSTVAEQLRAKKGPWYEKWRRNLMKSLKTESYKKEDASYYRIVDQMRAEKKEKDRKAKRVIIKGKKDV